MNTRLKLNDLLGKINDASLIYRLTDKSKVLHQYNTKNNIIIMLLDKYCKIDNNLDKSLVDSLSVMYDIEHLLKIDCYLATFVNSKTKNDIFMIVSKKLLDYYLDNRYTTDNKPIN